MAGFLGVHIEQNEKDWSIKLTQKGLTSRIIEALGVTGKKPTLSTCDALPIDAEGDPKSQLDNHPSVM